MAKKSKLEILSDKALSGEITRMTPNDFTVEYNYLDYIRSSYGTENYAYRFIDGLIANKDMSFMMKLHSTGVIDDFNIPVARAGIITTNPNGIDTVSSPTGTDTKLGILNNTFYSDSLYMGSLYNNARGRNRIHKEGEFKIPSSYITPSMFNHYGNNLNNIYDLSDKFRVHSSSGRTVDDVFTRHIGIIHDYNEGNVSEQLLDYSSKVYLNDALSWGEKDLDGGMRKYGLYNPNGNEFYNYYIGFNREERNPLNSLEDLKEDDEYKLGLYHEKIGHAATRIESKDKYNSPPKDHFVYAEKERVDWNDDADEGNKWDVYHPSIDGPTAGTAPNGLLRKTYDMINSGIINTMFARFYENDGLTNEGNRNRHKDENYTIDTAIDDNFGHSHGRNLLTSDAENRNVGLNVNGYENPYCRVWTFHHQYNNVVRQIRPFQGEAQRNTIDNKLKAYAARFTGPGKIDDGRTYLNKNTVLDRGNGRVNITPKLNDNQFNNSNNNGDADAIKRCMFSIENLAWKDVNLAKNLSREQRGPNGGRIMWFPPYGLEFSENVNVNWNPNQFIGRGEKVYTYTDTDRMGNLSFIMIVDHPSILNAFRDPNAKENELRDTDVLRFFAGCFDGTLLPDPQPLEDEPQPTDDNPALTQVADNEIKFFVFFPNNYSGHRIVNGDENFRLNTQSYVYAKSKDMNPEYNKRFEQRNFYDIEDKLFEIQPDNDWDDYLISGSHIDGTDGQGYEMDGSYNENGKGISDGYSATDSSGIRYCGKEYYFNGDLTKSATPKTNKKHKGNEYYFQYRVDNDLNQIMKNIDDYTDSRSTGLNKDKENVKKSWIGSTPNYSFNQIYQAKSKDKSSEADDVVDERLLNVLIRDVIDGGYKVESVTVHGYATRQDGINSTKLSNRRCMTVASFLYENFAPKLKDAKWTLSSYEDGNSNGDVDNNNAKKYRCAIVSIKYNASSMGKASDEVGDEVNSNGAAQVNEVQNNEAQNNSGDTKEYHFTARNIANRTIGWEPGIKTNGRYENEYEYFKRIGDDDPLIYKRIREKITHFDPAYHSMSPEGFNARLTFLHQCTRQGHTISVTDGNTFAETASNLAFGRMPVCILRIGDFIYTRILIQSISIQYSENGMHWDMNPEGIGMQPMFARINMGIHILGGQSLEGPINRLQNAVTFNYYANAGVYDNRSDRAKPSATGITYDSLYIPKGE